MKKYLVGCLFFFVAISSQAYDYQIISSGRTCFFNVSYGDTEYPEQKAYKIDSIRLSGVDSVYYPNVNFVPVGGCIKGDGSWIGRRIVVKSDGTNVIYNYKNEPIELRTQAKLNEKWVMYQRGETIKATAEVTSIAQVSFLGLTDSVKTITVNVVDLRYNYVQAPPLVILKISKKFGIIRTKIFFSFPEMDNGAMCSLSGLSNPKVGMQNLLWSDVWDIKPGTELHFLFQKTGESYYICRFVKEKLIYKERKESQDSIYITSEAFTQDSLLKDSVGPIIHYSSTFAVSKSNPNFDLLPNSPFQLDSDFSIFTQDAEVKGHSYSDSYTLNDSCYTSPIFDCFGCNCSYGSSYHKNLGGAFDHSLVYYRRGDVSWGTPIVISAIANYRVDKIVKVNYLTDKQQIQLKIGTQYLPAQFGIYDLTGKELRSFRLFDSETMLPINDLAAGVYLYKVKLENSTIQSGKLLIRK